MTSTQFPLHRVIGDRPALEAGDVVFNAPRPLYGEDVETGLMGFSVVVGSDTYGRDGYIEQNRRLDARVIEWLSRDEALAEAHAYVTAEYGADVADDDTLLDVWAHHFRLTTTDIDAEAAS